MGSSLSVSVLLPTFDDPDHVSKAIDSVRSQTVETDVEVLVVDSSSDGAVERIVSEYGPSVRYLWTEPEGVAAARNRGIDAATGDVIGFCDADDYWHPEKVAHQLPLIEDGFDVVYSDEYLVGNGPVSRIPSPSVVEPDAHHVTHFRYGGIGSRSVLVRRDALEEMRFDERFALREDSHLWTRLFARYTAARVGKALSYKRRRPNSLTADRDLAFEMELLEISDLVSRFPELKPYRKERIRRARLRYAKTLISEEGRSEDARAVLFDLVKDGEVTPRLPVLLLVSALPAGNKRTLRGIQDLYWKLQSRKVLEACKR